MKKIYWLILSATVALLTTGCIIDTNEEMTLRNPGMTRLHLLPYNFTLVNSGGNIVLHFDDINNDKNENAFGMSLKWREAHGDTAFFKPELESWIRDYLRADFTQVKVWSDADFDAEHPAGSSLNDITRFVSFSPMPYIRSGYQAEYQWDDQYRKSLEQLFSGLNIRTNYVYPIDKKVSELTADDMQMLKLGEFSFLNNVGLLILPTPTLAKSHTISVEMTINAGNTFTDSLEMSWP